MFSAGGIKLFLWSKARPAVIGAVLFGIAVDQFTRRVAFVGQFRGRSMCPTINEANDMAIVSRLSDYQVGDIVVSKCMNSNAVICKRIRAVSGDVIGVRENGEVERFRIPNGHVWLQGDNPEESNDSRSFGPVPMGMLLGRVVAKSSWTNEPHFEVFKRFQYVKDVRQVSGAMQVSKLSDSSEGVEEGTENSS